MEALSIESCSHPPRKGSGLFKRYAVIGGGAMLLAVILFTAWFASLPSAVGHPSVRTKRVFIFRHCVRDCGGKVDKINVTSPHQEYKDVEILSPHPPDFIGAGGAGGRLRCTSVGAKIMEETGQFLKRKGLVSQSSFHMIMDDVHRDITSGNAIGRGIFGEDAWRAFKSNSTHVGIRGALFDDTKLNHESDKKERDGVLLLSNRSKMYRCKKFRNTTILKADAQDKLNTVLLPMEVGNASTDDYTPRLHKLFERMHTIVGEAPLLNVTQFEQITATEHGVVGASRLLKYFAQNLLYSWSSAMNTSFTFPSKDEIYNWAGWIYYTHMTNPTSRVVHSGLRLLNTIITDLQRSSSPDSILYIGHDKQMDAIAEILGIDWEAGAFGYRGSPPGSSLIFSRENDSNSVEIGFLFTDFDGRGSGQQGWGIVSPARMTLEDMTTAYEASYSRNTDLAACAQVAMDTTDEDYSN